MSYAGVYRAKCVAVSGNEITAYIPQVYATKSVTFTSRTGVPPSPGDTGWVMFEGGRADYPVWVSLTGSSGTPTVVTNVTPSPLPVGKILSGTLESGAPMSEVGTVSFPKGPHMVDMWFSILGSDPDSTLSDFNVSFDPQPNYLVVSGINFASLPIWLLGTMGSSIQLTASAILDEPSEVVSTVTWQVNTSLGTPVDVKLGFVFTPITLTS